jgi:squalene-hopene/tetraprenyl-beta-curcumene cyclase
MTTRTWLLGAAFFAYLMARPAISADAPALTEVRKYAEALVSQRWEEVGPPSHEPAVERGIAWLKSHQRASGRWFTRSLNKDNEHFISHAGSAFAVMALSACDEK